MDEAVNYSITEFVEFFKATQPVINNLKSVHNEKTFKFLCDKIQKASVNLILKLETFLLHPLVNFLEEQDLTSDERQGVLECIGAVIEKTGIRYVKEYFTLYTITCNQIMDTERNEIKSGISEELKLSAVNCLKIFTKRLEPDVVATLYASEIPFLCQGIFLAIQVILKEKSTKLRCLALEFLLAASQYDHNITEDIAAAFSKFTPGVIGPLRNVIIKDKTAHHQLAVRCWGHIIETVLKDYPKENNEKSEDLTIQSWMKPKSVDSFEEKNILGKGERTHEWVKAAARTLQPVFEDVAYHCQNHHPNVRNEMINISEKILKNCAESLGPGRGVFLDTLVQLSQDEYETIQRNSQRALASLETGNFPVRQTAQERLPLALEKLSKNLLTSNEDVHKSLNLIASYLNLFPLTENFGPIIMTNPLLLTKLINVLVTTSKIQFNDDLLQQFDSQPLDFQSTYEPLGLINKKSEKNFNAIFKHLGHWSFENSVHLLIENLKNSKDRLENLAVLIKIISQSEPKMTEFLLQYFLDTNNEIDCYSLGNGTAKDAKIIIVRAMLILQGIGYLAKAIGNDFQNHLLKTLYPVVEKLGCSFLLIRSTAFSSAKMIAVACGYCDIAALIENNLDYLTHRIIVKLQRTSDEAVLDAVRVIAKLCPSKAVPQLQHIVNQILSSSASHIHTSHVEAYLRVFLAFVYCAANPTLSISNSQQLTAMLELKAKKENKTEEDENEETKPNLPAYVVIAEKVVRRCLHYLPTCPDRQKVICLEILDTGLKVLAEWEDQLLPLVHEVWSPLVRRFHPNVKVLIISRSFRLLCTLTSLAKDFIRHRTLKEVLPTIRDFLVHASKISHNHSKDIAYETTQHYKLQRELLNGLGGMTCDLKLHERETNWVVEAALPYLSTNQPNTLQRNAVGLYQTLLSYDPVLVAYRLQPMITNDEFKKNVQTILATSTLV